MNYTTQHEGTGRKTDVNKDDTTQLKEAIFFRIPQKQERVNTIITHFFMNSVKNEKIWGIRRK